MQIANPIYDVVFKYLMEDEKVAKLIISTIIGEDIVELDFLPQESTLFLETRSLTVYRLDFSAKIKQPDGNYKQVIIEIQKAKFATDIMRFRRYLGEQYQEKNNSYIINKNGKDIRIGMPIVSIYFLGYKLEHITAPIIKVARHYYDLTTGQEIQERERFIESLTHNSYVIQIPHLKPTYQSEIEQLLSIFNQNTVTSDQHILNINETDYPQKYWEIIRRLQKAIATPEVKRSMDVEDDILEELQDLEREIERKDKTIQEQDKTIQDKDKTIQDKDKALKEQQQIIAELQKRLESST